MEYTVVLGRILYAFVFVQSLPGHFTSDTIAYAAKNGVLFPEILVPLSGIIAFLGGLSVILGFRARYGAILIIVFLVPVTVTMHRFWGLPEPAAHMQYIHFIKNVSMLGGALLIAWFGSGPLSIDNRMPSHKAIS